MAEQVQSILERMVLPLKDLRTRSIFSSEEITSIIERRRRSEYLLQRRNGVRKADYLQYIEDEMMLERLRKLRKEKVLVERMNDWVRRHEEGEDSDDDGNDGNNNKKKHAYKISGPGDSHIISHIHFLYQRTLRKFHFPLDVTLNYAQFAKDVKSFQMLGRIYAEGLQHHPREEGLWIEAASFEYFGYVAQDYEQHSNPGNKKKDGEVSTKVVGSSIQNARVLLQRGLRVNKKGMELWLQYFALELHYVQKLRGRKEILELTSGGKQDKKHESGSDSSDGKDEEGDKKMPTSLLPAQIIFKNAIKAIPSDVQFRLRFVEACRQFPLTKPLEDYIMTSVTLDFGQSVEAWVARIAYADEEFRNQSLKKINKGKGVGFLEKESESDDDEDGSGGEDERPSKKARVESQAKNNATNNTDPALDLLQEAIQAIPTPKMYLEATRFLRLRIQHLMDYDPRTFNEENKEEEDGIVSHLIGKEEDAEGAAQRHAHLLEELYHTAIEEGVSSTMLTLDHVDFLLTTGQIETAEKMLSNSVGSGVDVRLWLKWAEISQQMMEEESDTGEIMQPSTSTASILRRALKHTPLHDRRAHTLVLTRLMQCLMMTQQKQSSSTSKMKQELKSLFQKLLLLSQGGNVSVSSVKKVESEDEAEEEDVNLAATFLAYLNYTMQNNNKDIAGDDDNDGIDNTDDVIDNTDDAVRSIYTSVLYHSNYGKSCAGKTDDEIVDMKSFFDTCIQFEKTTSTAGKKKGGARKARKMRLCKLYEAAIGFYATINGNSSSVWRKVVDGYQRDLDDVKYSF